MIKNYFKIAFRNLLKNKAFTIINIFGLAVGFTCCLLISSFLYDELSYDKFPKDASNIYRVELNVGNKDFYSAVDVAVTKGMKNTYPEIESHSRLGQRKNVIVKNGDKQFKEPAIAYVDSNFLQFFSIPLTQGNVQTALIEPNSIVLSKSVAEKYFGTTNAIGKTLLINNDTSRPVKVTGILADMPGKLHFDFEFYSTYYDNPNRQTWSNIGCYSYIKLKPGTDVG